MTSEKPNKRQTPLTLEEIDFIRTHGVMPGWTDKKIAAHLNIAEPTVKKYRNKYKIKKGGNTLEIESTSVPKDSINKANIPEEEKLKLWKNYFKGTAQYKRIKQEMTSEDLDYFIERWATYHLQFDELKPTEEASIIKLVTLDLRMSDSRRDYRKMQEEEQRLERELGGRELQDLENEEDRILFEMIQGNIRLKMECNKQLLDLNKNHELLLRELNATREQREQTEKIGADTFANFVKLLTDEERRIRSNNYTEYMKLSTEKKTKEFKQLHTYVDNTQDRILLDGNDFIKKDSQNV